MFHPDTNSERSTENSILYANAGPYSASGSGPNINIPGTESGLSNLDFQADSSGLITGWFFFVGRDSTATVPGLAVNSLAPLTSKQGDDSLGVSGFFAGDVVDVFTLTPAVVGQLRDVGISITPGQWSVCANGSCSLPSDASLSVPSDVVIALFAGNSRTTSAPCAKIEVPNPAYSPQYRRL